MGKQNHRALVGFIIILTALPWLVGIKTYWLSVLVLVGIYSLVTIGLSLLMGYAGQISLGHGAFFGLGAYTSGLLTVKLAWNPWIALTAGLVLTAGAAFLIGLPTLRLSGHYLAMATMAFGEILSIFFTATVDVTGGPSGFGNIPRLSIAGFVFNTDLRFYFLIWSWVIVILILALNLIHSRVGRALRSIHGGEAAANAMGVNTSQYKIQIFVVSAMLAALAGGFYSHYITFISPDACELKFSIIAVVMVAVGGMNHLWGAVVGAALLTLLPEYLGALEDYDMLIYGLILMSILIFLPEGLMGGIHSFAGRFHKSGRVKS